MDPLVTSVLMAVSGLGVQLTAAVNQYLRLRWRERQEHARRQTLEALARSLPRGCRMEEVASDGTTLRLTISQLPDRPEEHR